MPTPVFSFPYHEVVDQYPKSTQPVQFGSGYEFSPRPVGPDQMTYILKFPAMWWFVNSSGGVDLTVSPERNMGAFLAFYESVRCSDWFTYQHPRRGTVTARFKNPVVTPRVIPTLNGCTEPFEVEIIEQPVLKIGDLQLTEETTLLLAAMSSQATTRQRQIDNVIRELKAAGVWNKIDCLYVLAANTSQSALQNWKQPTPGQALTIVGAPTFTANRGFTGTDSAVANYLSGPTSTFMGNFQQDSAFAAAWVLNNPTLTTNYAVLGAANAFYLIPRTITDTLAWRLNNSTNTINSGVTDSRGLHLMTRTGPTVSKYYKNSLQIGADSAIASTAPISALRVLANSSAESCPFQCALVATGGALTDVQETAFYNIMRTYLLALGASV